MSLLVDTGAVQAVLLADRWHRVKAQTFDINGYQYVWNDTVFSEPGEMGFKFVDRATGAIIMGPLQSMLAVRLVHEGAEDD
jgi:hypothetical protein